LIPASSRAATVTVPPASIVPCAPVNSMNASAALETLLEARIPPAASPDAP